MSRIAEFEKAFQKMRVVITVAAALAATGCACNGLSEIRMLAGGGSSVPVSAALDLSPQSLPLGVTASYPAFDGDSFSAILSVRALADQAPGEALEEIAPILRAIGFQRPLGVLQVPEGPIRLPPPDVAALAGEVCREMALAEDPAAQKVCAALRGGGEDIDGIAELRSELEHPVLQYVYPQLVEGVPIEGSGVFASRKEGESLSEVHGTLFNRYVVANRPLPSVKVVLDAARRLLAARLGADRLPEIDATGAELVLLAYGSGRLVSGEEVPALRHALRTFVRLPGSLSESWMAWIDAGTGAVLDLRSQSQEASPAQGKRWRRDPGLSVKPTEVVPFEVDPPAAAGFILALDDAAPKVFKRFDRLGDRNFDDGEVSVDAAGPMADFNQIPMNQDLGAHCQNGKNGGNRAFRQVHAYSHLYSFWKTVVSAGTFPLFPEHPIEVWIDYDKLEGNNAYYDGGGDGRSVLVFVDGPGFLAGNCPNAPNQRLNGVHDVTVLTHEMAHLGVARLQERRPKGWCRPAPADPACPLSTGHDLFHDFADAFSFAYASTNCFSGWAHKNLPTANASLYCKGATDEEGGFPRLAHVGDAFNPASAGDHFPEHRSFKGDYADGQIAAAALWKVRQGLRSRDLAAGTAEFWVRLNRALWNFGFLRPTCKQGCDRDIYRYLQDLEKRMVDQWAMAANSPATGAHTANKVLGGWAKAGIFLVPFQCFDGDVRSKDPKSCPLGEGAGDAVIDVDDRDPADDLVADGVTHPEVDYLERNGPAPLFRVWTGPRFRFARSGAASTAAPFPCHAKLKVEVASNPAFTQNLWESGEITAFPAGGPGCYAEVELESAAWARLQMAPSAKIYYRVRTWSASGTDERISTSPGAGTYTVPPPFAMVNDSGRP